MLGKAGPQERRDEEKTKEELLLELRYLRELSAGQQIALENLSVEGERNYRKFADNAKAGILVYQGEDTVYVNKAMSEIDGYSAEERLRMKFWKPVHPAFVEEVRRRGAERQKGLIVHDRNELKIIRKSGEERWVVASSSTFREKGKPAVMLIVQDITELKLAEEALKKSQYILAKAQQIAHLGNWAWNLRTGQMNWSDEGFRIFGYEPGEVRPTIDWLLGRVHPDDREILKGFIDRVLLDRQRYSVDYRIVRPDGSVRYVNMVADKIVIGRSGVPERAYGINQDVTERKHAEEALSRAKNEAELYVDLMGHDINNMNQITMGYLELAHNILEYEGKLGPENVHLLEKAIDSLGNSSKLIDNVRKMQREKLGLYRPEVIDIGPLLEEMVEQFRSIPNRDVRIEYTLKDVCRVRANALLRDVFMNLIGNSIKHSTGTLNMYIEAGCIDVDGEKYCKVSVEDDGPGIPDALKLTLFDRLNLATTRARGKGFGLCLIKMLVDDYGGRFWVEDRVDSDYSQGSRFVVLLPVSDL